MREEMRVRVSHAAGYCWSTLSAEPIASRLRRSVDVGNEELEDVAERLGGCCPMPARRWAGCWRA